MDRSKPKAIKWWYLPREGADGRGTMRESPEDRERRKKDRSHPEGEPEAERSRGDSSKRDYYREDWVAFGRSFFHAIADNTAFGINSRNPDKDRASDSQLSSMDREARKRLMTLKSIEPGIDTRGFASAIGTTPDMLRKVLHGRNAIPADAIAGDGKMRSWFTPLRLPRAELDRMRIQAWLCHSPVLVVYYAERLVARNAVLRARNNSRRRALIKLGVDPDEA